MRLATYNVEWFNSLFNDKGELLDDGAWSGRYDITRSDQIAALGHVFRSLDADAVMVIEAPDFSRHRNGVEALERFAAHFDLRAREALMGFSNDTQQEIMLLYDPEALKVRHDPVGAVDAPRFDGVLGVDIDVDTTLDPIRWSKPPLEISAETAAGTVFRMIGVHAKSKAPHGARSKKEENRIAIENRRKQLAQCIWLRRRVLDHLTRGDKLIVLGDFNDGPGLDEYERLFGHSGVEIVLGVAYETESQLFDPHAEQALQRKLGVQPGTARFFNQSTGRYISALLDYIMVSPDLAELNGKWRIWHPFDDPECWSDVAMREALMIASDHYPVTLDIDL